MVLNGPLLFIFDKCNWYIPVLSFIFSKRCNPGHLIDPDVDTITLKCIGENIWSTDPLPIRLMHVDHNHLTDLSLISCITPCPSGYIPVGKWCIQVCKDYLNNIQPHKTFFSFVKLSKKICFHEKQLVLQIYGKNCGELELFCHDLLLLLYIGVFDQFVFCHLLIC